MKKIVLISLFSVVVTCLMAQERAELYTKNLDAYVGTWEFTSDTCTFRIYLKKGKDYYSKGGRLRSEIVYGGHYIERNGVVITNLAEIIKTATDEDSRMTIVASNSREEESEVNPNVVGFVFSDELKEKRGSGLLTLMSGNPAQLHWQIQRMSEKVVIYTIGVDPEPVLLPGWTVPTDIILTKVPDEFPIIRDSLITRDPDFIFRPLSD